MIKVFTIEKIGHHKPAYALALQECGKLVQKGIFSWGPAWDLKGLVAMDGETCAGLLTYSKDEDENYVYLDFMCVNPEYKGPQIFILLLSKLKEICKALGVKNIQFVYHNKNPDMKDAARILNAEVVSIKSQITLD